MQNKGIYYKYNIIIVVFLFLGNFFSTNTTIQAADTSLPDSIGMIIHRAGEGDLEKVQRILEVHPSAINYRGDNNGTALHSACAAGHLDLVNFLIENGADIEAEDKYGRTPILMSKSIDIVKYLVNKGADYKKVSKHGQSVLHEAAFDGDIELLKYWVEHGVDLEYKQGVTPLLCAASRDNKDAAEYLLSVGADINAVTDAGETIVHIAANATDYSLLEDPNISETTNNTGKTIKFLLQKNLDINRKDNNGDTPLHKVVHYRTQISAELLISHNAELNIQNNEGQTPLYIAARSSGNDDNLKMVKLLVEKGADVNLRTKDNDTALHAAVRNSNYEMAKYLLEKGAEVNPCLSTSCTALHSAARLAKPDLVKLLIDYGANVNARDRSDSRFHGIQPNLNTPLFYAAKAYGNYSMMSITGQPQRPEPENIIEVINLLLDNGAYINTQNSVGQTPLDIAIQIDNQEVIKFLEEKGAKGNAKEGDQYAYGEKQRWINSLILSMPHTFYQDENIINYWWPIDTNPEYTYKITNSTWEDGKKWIDTEFKLKIVQDKQDKNRFNFEVEGFDEFPYKGLIIENNRIFAINENGKEKNALIVFPLTQDAFFSSEESEQEFLDDAITNTTDELFYAPVKSGMWHVLRVEGERYYVKQSLHRPLYYTFEKNTGLIKWYVTGGYEFTLVKINENDYIQPGYVKDGLYCSLRTEKIIWERSDKPKLLIDIENKGNNKYNLNLSNFEIDINGNRFVPELKNTDSVSLEPGKQYEDIEIVLDNSLIHKEKNYRFNFSPHEYEYNIFLIYKVSETTYIPSNPVKLQLEIDFTDRTTGRSSFGF